MKVLVGESDDRILFFTMLGPEAGESWPQSKPRCSPSFHSRSFATPFWRT